MERGEIRLRNETLVVLDPYLVVRGVPLPPGVVREPGGAHVVDATGKVLPSSGKVLQRRSDGSIEWLLMDIQVPLGGQEEKSIYVVPAPPKVGMTVKNPVVVRESGDDVTLGNGRAELVLSRAGGSLIRRLSIGGKTLIDESTLVDLHVVDTGGKIHRASLSGRYAITIMHQNPLRTEVKVEGKHKSRDGCTLLDFALRFTLSADSPDVKLEYTFYCRESREGKILIRAIKLVMPTTMDPAAAKLVRQSHHGHDWFAREIVIPENVEVVASSVPDVDNYNLNSKGPGVSHPSAGGLVFVRNMDSFHEDWSQYPFHMRPGQGSGFRADLMHAGIRQVAPVIGWRGGDFSVVTTFEHFRQLHPKSIAIDECQIVYSIWPEWSTPMVVVQGVSKSHIIWITGQSGAMNMDEVENVLFRWEYGYVEPVDISFDPAWPAHCQVFECHQMLKYQPLKYPVLENLIEVAPAAGNPARHTYDRQPAQGMFHFGDIVSADASSCTNNEDDINVLFPLQQFLRTGHTYAWDYGKESARHYMEVDFVEWSTDPRQKGGLIPHTGQHFIGNVYSSHQWAEGILAYYYLSGDERARNVVLQVAENHIYWTYNCTHLVCCDGREAGVPLINLAAAYRLNPDERYLKAAKHICENFYLRWEKAYGEFKYPYPQGTSDHPHKLITGYGDWSSFAGLYRLFEVSGDRFFGDQATRLLKAAIKPGSFSLNDARGMDFFAAWCLGRLTGDMDAVVKIVGSAVPMLLRRGGHPLRRLHFLKELDERDMIDDRFVGSRGGVI